MMILTFLIIGIWPMFHYDSCRTGLTPAKGELDSIKLKWKWTLPDSSGIGYCSPAVGEIEIEEIPTKIVVIGANNGELYVLNGSDGSLLWSFKTNDYIWSSPLLMDIDNDDTLETVFGSNDGKVYALKVKLTNGTIYWSYQTRGGIISSPVAGDIDGDNYPEIAIGSKDSVLYVFEHNGDVKWSYKTDAPIESSPCFGDNTTSVVVATMNGKIYGLSATGMFMWSFSCGEIQSSPAMGDLNKDGILDVVVGSEDCNVYAIDGATGFPLWSYSTGANIDYESPALADIDNDDTLEVIIGSFDELLHCIEGGSGTRKWAINPSTISYPIPSSVAIADIDNDGILEIVGGTHCGDCYALKPDGSLKWRYRDIGDAHSSPTLADIDNDNLLEVVIGSLTYYSVYALDFPVAISENKNQYYNFKLIPNPFYKFIKINFSLPQLSYVNISIYNILGEKVAILKNEILPPGNYSISWDNSISPGIYFCKITTDNQIHTFKIIKLCQK